MLINTEIAKSTYMLCSTDKFTVLVVSLFDNINRIHRVFFKKSAQKAYGKIKDKMGTLSKPKKRARSVKELRKRAL